MLVAYTRAASKVLGDDSLAWLDLVISDTNKAFENSGVNARVTLAGHVPVRYKEVSISSDHAALTYGDGKLAKARYEQRKVGADLVVLVGGYLTPGGYAPRFIGAYKNDLQKLAQDSVAVISAEAMTAGYGFTHELGHLFGAGHDIGSAGSKENYQGWEYGHIQPAAADPHGPWKSVMSYTTHCPRCATRLYWSNPSTDKYGDRMGNADSQDNARAISSAAPTIANLHCYLAKSFSGT